MATARGSDRQAEDRRAPLAHVAVETAAFVAELAMFVTLGLAGWRLGGGELTSIAMAALYPALAVLLWTVWLAPRAVARLADPWRLLAQIALFLGTGVLSAVAGRTELGIAVAALGIASFVAARRFDGVRAPQSLDIPRH